MRHERTRHQTLRDSKNRSPKQLTNQGKIQSTVATSQQGDTLESAAGGRDIHRVHPGARAVRQDLAGIRGLPGRALCGRAGDGKSLFASRQLASPPLTAAPCMFLQPTGCTAVGGWCRAMKLASPGVNVDSLASTTGRPADALARRGAAGGDVVRRHDSRLVSSAGPAGTALC